MNGHLDRSEKPLVASRAKKRREKLFIIRKEKRAGLKVSMESTHGINEVYRSSFYEQQQPNYWIASIKTQG